MRQQRTPKRPTVLQTLSSGRVVALRRHSSVVRMRAAAEEVHKWRPWSCPPESPWSLRHCAWGLCNWHSPDTRECHS